MLFRSQQKTGEPKGSPVFCFGFIHVFFESGPDAALVWRRYFVTLLSNKIYNVLGGVTPIIIAPAASEVCINFLFLSCFFCLFRHAVWKNIPNLLTIKTAVLPPQRDPRGMFSLHRNIIEHNFLYNEKRMAIPNAILFWRRYFCYLLGVAKTI